MPPPPATGPRPTSLASFDLPRRQSFFPSPVDWRDEILYFLLPDRFSDGAEIAANLLDRSNLPAVRGPNWKWSDWTLSGKDRYQGGTLKGVQSKLPYLKDLGATVIWIGPIFKQRVEFDGTYHGYGIQDFLEVDPHFGTRQDLVDLVSAAHTAGLRVILDIVFNHSGDNWIYANVGPGNDPDMPPFKPFPTFYDKGPWRNAAGGFMPNPTPAANLSADDAVWPADLHADENYTRAGYGGLGGEDIDDPHAVHKRTDFFGLRDFNLDNAPTLNNLARCYKYWIALTDCDGFRLDTLKHVSLEDGRNFCGTIKEFAANLGKRNFFLVGEVGGDDGNAQRYLDVLERNLSATLDIGSLRTTLVSVAKGFTPPSAYLNPTSNFTGILGSHRLAGERHVSVLNDHDHVFGEHSKFRFATDGPPVQNAAAVALQLFSLGIPCIYAGTEQALAAPEASERIFLSNFGDEQAYLREAMFGPPHPRKSKSNSLAPGTNSIDTGLPGFGPFGTAGKHCFDPKHAVYVRIAHLAAVRRRYPVLRHGRQYQRAISNFNSAFALPAAGELIAFSRILDDEEALIVINGNGAQDRGGDILIDPALTTGSMQVVANSAEAAAIAAGQPYIGPHRIGSKPAITQINNTPCIPIRNLSASECLVLLNRPDPSIP